MTDQGSGQSLTDLTPLLNVEDTPTSIGFYTDILGFDVAFAWPEDGPTQYAELRAGAIRLRINQPDGADSAARLDNDRSYSDVVLYVTVEDAAALHAQLMAKGYQPTPVKGQHYGMTEFTLRDPDGYELAFGSPAADSPPPVDA